MTGVRSRPAGDEVEVVLHGVLGHAAHLLDAEAVRADDAQLLEVQGVHSKRFGGSTPETTSVPPVASSRSEVSTVSIEPIVS